MIRYKIGPSSSGIYFRIYVKSGFNWWELNNKLYNTPKEALDALNNIIEGQECIIKIV